MELNKGTKKYTLLVMKICSGIVIYPEAVSEMAVCKLRKKAGFCEDCQDNGINMLKQ